MDSKGRYLDNIFIERLWRSLKYEEAFLNAYASIQEARASIGSWFILYNGIRLHQALGYRTRARCSWRRQPVGMWTTQAR